MSVHDLIESQIAKKLSAEKILLCYIHEIRESYTGSEILDERFQDALVEARSADEARESGKVLGPLHGVPISVKDHLNVEGTVSCYGWSALSFDDWYTDADIIKALKRHGGIPFVKSNMVQGGFSIESKNRIFGPISSP